MTLEVLKLHMKVLDPNILMTSTSSPENVQSANLSRQVVTKNRHFLFLTGPTFIHIGQVGKFSDYHQF